jgi:hypothetical protein
VLKEILVHVANKVYMVKLVPVV